MERYSHRSGTLQAFIDFNAATKIPIIQSSLAVATNHDITKARIPVEDFGIPKRRRACYRVKCNIGVVIEAKFYDL